jgi:tRNA pseudouridine55 synthase
LTGAVYLLDKGRDVTSRRAAGEAARANGFRKYGHCGTLDPDATGLLVVVMGKATRLAPYLSTGTKRYSFTLVPGIETDTLDMTGEVIRRADASGITTEMVVEALDEVTGTFQQRVPIFSAVRVEGKRAYEMARKGLSPKMPERTVTVTDWSHGEMAGGRISLEATVSGGTYVRALARDIGLKLGIPAVADGIRRTAVWNFTLQEASTDPGCPHALLDMSSAVSRGYPVVPLSREDALRVVHGLSAASPVTGTAALLGPGGNLLAMGTGNGTAIKPDTVLASEEEL